MSEENIKIEPKDIAEGEELDFDNPKEQWNTYRLSDGTTLKIKIVLAGVRRLKKCNPDGTPIYITKSKTITRAIGIKPELLAKPTTSDFKPV